MAYRANQHDHFLSPTPGDGRHDTDSSLPSDRYGNETATSGRRIALYAVAVAVLVGALIYGMMTDTNTTTAQNTPGSITAQRMAMPPAPVGGDASPRSNIEPGMTTGAAPARTAPAPRTGSSGN
jgi:hypothetical protein